MAHFDNIASKTTFDILSYLAHVGKTIEAIIQSLRKGWTPPQKILLFKAIVKHVDVAYLSSAEAGQAGMKKENTLNRFVMEKPNSWGPEIEVRRKGPKGKPGRLEAIFLGSDAEAAARQWLEELKKARRKGPRKANTESQVSPTMARFGN